MYLSDAKNYDCSVTFKNFFWSKFQKFYFQNEPYNFKYYSRQTHWKGFLYLLFAMMLLHPITQHTIQGEHVLYALANLSSQILDQLLFNLFLLSMSWVFIFANFFNVKFADGITSGTPSSFLSQLHSSLMLTSLFSLCSSAYVVSPNTRSGEMAESIYPHSQLFLPYLFDSNFTLSVTAFHYSAAFPVLMGNSLL